MQVFYLLKCYTKNDESGDFMSVHYRPSMQLWADTKRKAQNQFNKLLRCKFGGMFGDVCLSDKEYKEWKK